MTLTLTRRTGTETPELVPRIKPLYANAYSDPPYEMSEGDIEQFEIRFTKHAGLDGFVLLTWGSSTEASLGSRTDLRSRVDDGGPVSRPTYPAQTLLQAPFRGHRIGVHTDVRGRGFSRQPLERPSRRPTRAFRESHLPPRCTGSRDVSTLRVEEGRLHANPRRPAR